MIEVRSGTLSVNLENGVGHALHVYVRGAEPTILIGCECGLDQSMEMYCEWQFGPKPVQVYCECLFEPKLVRVEVDLICGVSSWWKVLSFVSHLLKMCTVYSLFMEYACGCVTFLELEREDCACTRCIWSTKHDQEKHACVQECYQAYVHLHNG